MGFWCPPPIKHCIWKEAPSAIILHPAGLRAPCHRPLPDVGSGRPLQGLWQLQVPAMLKVQCPMDSHLVSPFPPMSCSLCLGTKSKPLKSQPSQPVLFPRAAQKARASSRPSEMERASPSAEAGSTPSRAGSSGSPVLPTASLLTVSQTPRDRVLGTGGVCRKPSIHFPISHFLGTLPQKFQAFSFHLFLLRPLLAKL